jgi:hypothetical protein
MKAPGFAGGWLLDATQASITFWYNVGNCTDGFERFGRIFA